MLLYTAGQVSFMKIILQSSKNIILCLKVKSNDKTLEGTDMPTDPFMMTVVRHLKKRD